MKGLPTVGGEPNTPADPTTADTYVIGGGALGAAFARRLQAEDHAVTLIDDTLELSDVPTHRSDPTDVRSLSEAGLDTASTVIVASPSDAQNLLVAQLVKVRFDVDRILVLTNHPDRARVMEDGGHTPVCAATALSNALANSL